MSYDIYFVRRDPGQSFADALDATEDSFDGDPGPLGSAELEQWERITERAGRILDGVEEFGTDNSRELSDAATGIQLSMIADEVTITVPTGRSQHASTGLMAKISALARIVEDETGLEGYDPQLQQPVTDRRPRISALATSHRGRPPSDDARSEAVAAPAANGEPQVMSPVPTPDTRRRRWKLWKW